MLKARWEAIIVFLSLLAIIVKLVSNIHPIGFIDGTPVEDLFLIGVAVIGGIPLIYNILQKILRGDFGADSLAAIAIITALYMREYLTADLIVLMLAGGAVFESYAVRKASSGLLALAERLPSVAYKQVDGGIEKIQLTDIQVGDMILIYPHETCPVDGIVIEGHGQMNESFLTGEPYYVPKVPGVEVISGAINGNTLLLIKASRLAQDSRYSKIMQVMELAEKNKPRLRRLGDQIGAIFTPFALAIALGSWYATGDSVRFLAVLVIATPCPLLIAIPVTIVSAIAMATRLGIIIKDPVILERLPTCQTAIFDKTGTLTYGTPEVVDVSVFNNYDRSTVLQLAASLEHYSQHPLARAIISAAKEAGLAYKPADHVEEPAGQGLFGEVGSQHVHLTNRRYLESAHPKEFKLLPATQPGLECLMVINKKLAAVIHFRDTIRKESTAFIADLEHAHQFQKIMIVSGDRPEEVEYLAQQLNITTTYANQTPEQKLEIVRRETALAPTLYVGDGINDAPAIVSATVGLAFGQSNSATAEAGGAVIFDSSLVKVDQLLLICTSMRHIALQSAVGGMLLSIIGMAFAAIGLIPPVAGALIQEGIDVLAILNALRLTLQGDVEAHIKG